MRQSVRLFGGIMQRKGRRLTVLLTVLLLLLCLCLLLLAQVHESLHEDDDCPVCMLARACRAEKYTIYTVLLIVFCELPLCLCADRRRSALRRPDTLELQNILLLS